MPVNPASIGNAYKRSDEYRKQKRQKGQQKLKRRMEIKKDEAENEGGDERKKVRASQMSEGSAVPSRRRADVRCLASLTPSLQRRLEANVPVTQDNSRQFGSSHLTSLPTASTSAAPPASDDEDDEEEEGADAEELAAPEEGGIDAIPASRSAPGGPAKDPKILITTSQKVCKETYTFAEELRGIFPGGEFFKRPGGKCVAPPPARIRRRTPGH